MTIKFFKKFIKKIKEKEKNEFFEFLRSDIDKTVFPVKYQIADISGNEKSWLSIGTMVFFNKKIYYDEEFNFFRYEDKIIHSRINLKKYMIQYIFDKISEEVESIEHWYNGGFHENLEVRLQNGENFSYSNDILDREII